VIGVRDVATVKAKLVACLNEVNEGRLTVTLADADKPLRELGVDSVALLAFLVAIEDTFAMEWSEDVAREVFTSIDSIAQYVDEHVPA
jgi:acyl carrier protein